MADSFLGIGTNPITIFTIDDKKNYLKNPADIDLGIRESTRLTCFLR